MSQPQWSSIPLVGNQPLLNDSRPVFNQLESCYSTPSWQCSPRKPVYLCSISPNPPYYEDRTRLLLQMVIPSTPSSLNGKDIQIVELGSSLSAYGDFPTGRGMVNSDIRDLHRCNGNLVLCTHAWDNVSPLKLTIIATLLPIPSKSISDFTFAVKPKSIALVEELQPDNYGLHWYSLCPISGRLVYFGLNPGEFRILDFAAPVDTSVAS